MLLVLELDVADLAATRFAISPLSETVRAIQLLADRDMPMVNAPWVRWARSELGWRPLRLPRLWPLIVNGLPVYPEFLVPAPEVRMPELGAELARLRATPAAAIRASLHPDLHWSGGTLTLTDTDQGPSPLKIMLGPDGVVLMPSIFNWPLVSPSRATSTQTVVLYPARGAATVWEGGAWAGSTWT